MTACGMETEHVLKIHISPPFYLSTWAYLLYLLLFFFCHPGVSVISGKRNRQKHQQAMEKV